MPNSLAGKTALITGGGVGIGFEIAAALAAAGARVAVTYRSHQPDDEQLKQLVSSDGSRPLAIASDATSDPSAAELMKTIENEFGKLDILVNNAGGLIQRCLIKDMDFALWRSVQAVNTDSAFLTTHHALSLLSSPGGRIINIASLAGRNGGHPGATAYATSKAALFGFTRGLAKEVAPDGITVNAIAPGFIEATPFHDTFTSASSKAATISGIPAGRAGRPGDVADAVLWLAGEGSSFVSGTVVDVNGAQYFG
ncbi:MAG: SDR family oxidoreductase [Actinomycetota bacterium]|nr:SDR family oxidoreductase [Actinomycetota bacterium]